MDVDTQVYVGKMTHEEVVQHTSLEAEDGALDLLLLLGT